MAATFRQLITEEDGQDLVEYGLITGFIAVVCYLGIYAAGQSISSVWDTFLTKATAAAAAAA